jgi:hypothetical protein
MKNVAAEDDHEGSIACESAKREKKRKKKATPIPTCPITPTYRNRKKTVDSEWER